MVIDPNIIPIVGIVFGLPSIALATRWVMKPIMDAYMRDRELKARAVANPGQLAAQDQRIAELESELAAVRQELIGCPPSRASTLSCRLARPAAAICPRARARQPADRSARRLSRPRAYIEGPAGRAARAAALGARSAADSQG